MKILTNLKIVQVRKLCFLTFMLGCLSFSAFSQIKTYAPERSVSEKTSRKPNARTQEIPIPLPFWDDFSFSEGHPEDSLWIVNNTVFVNDGQAINPPSFNVATFDG